MLTRKRWTAPVIPSNLDPAVSQYLQSLNKSISDYWLSLEGKNSLTINQAQIYADQGIQFPATQVASTDANNLDDYKEDGTWTPTIGAGSGAFTTVSATGKYTKIGNVVTYRIVITITTNGTAGTYISFTTPFTASGIDPVSGFETASTFVLGGYLNGSNGLVYKYDSTYPGADGRSLVIRGVCTV